METPLLEEELLAQYAAGMRSFVRIEPDDRSYNFAGAVLVGADFTGDCCMSASGRYLPSAA